MYCCATYAVRTSTIHLVARKAWCTMNLMSTKKGSKQNGTNGDRHKEPKMTLRFSKAAGDALRAIAEAEERTVTAVVQRALRAYAKANGYEWPGLPSAENSTH